MASLRQRASAGYCVKDWRLWQQGDCHTYAHALKRLRPSLRFGELGESDHGDGGVRGWWPTHTFVHDDMYAYDSAGRHPLPYHGLDGRADVVNLDVPEREVEFPDEDKIDQAIAHAKRHRILEGKHARRGNPVPQPPLEVTPARARAVAAEAQVRHGKDWIRHVELYLFPAERIYLLTRARDEGRYWDDVFEEIRTGRRENPVPLLAGVAALFAAFPITPVVAGVAAVNHRGRKRNPIREGAFARYEDMDEDWTPSKLEGALNLAEARFGVELAGTLYGCGTYGCAAPLTDGRVLKVTIDKLEETWASLQHEHRFRDTVRVYTKPEVVAVDDWYQGEGPDDGQPLIAPFDIFAYVRDEAGDLPDDGLSGKPDLAVMRPYLTEIAQVRARATRAYERAGYILSDLGLYNLGFNDQGRIVVRDARAFPIAGAR